jgi:hypothetical protein
MSRVVTTFLRATFGATLAPQMTQPAQHLCEATEDYPNAVDLSIESPSELPI